MAWPLSEGRDSGLLGLFRVGFLGQVPDRVGVAVSGGGDSLALLHMAIRARPHLGWQVFAVTVDHGLRPESADEAVGVAAFCAAHGISHQTLQWRGPDAQGNLMDQARRARFALISDWAKGHEIGDVLLGHTADDDAESFLMNLAREAGIDGLSGMRGDWQESGVHWHRPLLQLTRATLRAYLTRNAVAWVDDPTNDNPRFTRVKARRAMAALAPLGITVEKLSQTISHLADARQGLVMATAQVAARTVCQAGMLRLPVEDFAALAPEIARRFLSEAIRWMGGEGFSPRGSQLFTLQLRLSDGADGQLGGVSFRQRKGQLHITREPRAAQPAASLGKIWDHRWRIMGPAVPGLEIRALGAEGLRQCPDWRDHGPREALLVSPAVWAENRLIAAPFAGMAGDYRAELTQPLVQFILSH